MREIRALACIAIFLTSAAAFARQPESRSEQALIYWRYLCRNQIQTETVTTTERELSCPSLGWSVKTAPHDGRVKEVIDHGH